MRNTLVILSKAKRAKDLGEQAAQQFSRGSVEEILRWLRLAQDDN
jgi:hypothetical protein